jgi:hypothetical protein
MIAILLAESGGVVNIIGDNFASGHQTEDSNKRWDDGLGQVNSQHGYDRKRLLQDPSYNIGACKEIFARQGFGAWVAYNNGRYLQYMEAADPKAQAAVDEFQAALQGFSATASAAAVELLCDYLLTQRPDQFRIVLEARGWEQEG